MASGDTIWELGPLDGSPPDANAATLDTITDAAAAGPKTIIPVLDFDGSAADESYEWNRIVPSNYSGGGFTWECWYAMDGTDGDAVELELRILNIDDWTTLTGDLNVDGQTASNLTDDPGTTADEVNETGTATLSHANAGSPGAGDFIVIRITRDYDHAANTDDLQLVKVHIKET